MKDLLEAVKASVLTAPPNSWPTFDGGTLSRHNYVTASEAGKCIRSLGFDKFFGQQKDPDEERLANFDDWLEKQLARSDLPDGIFSRGHNVEAWLVQTLRNVLDPEREALLLAGEDQRSFYDNKARVSGTPDGIYVVHSGDDDNEMVLMEFKSTAYPVTQAKPNHVTQVLTNMGLIRYIAKTMGGLEFCKVMGWNPGDFLDSKGNFRKWTCGRLYYVDSSDYFKVSTFEVEYDNGSTFTSVAKKARTLFDKDGTLRVNPAELEPEGLEQGGCNFCQHRGLCKSYLEDAKDKRAERLAPPKPPAPLVKLPKAGTPKDFTEAVDKYLSLHEREAELSAAKEALDKEVIRPYMADPDNGVSSFEIDHDEQPYKLTLTKQTRDSFDKKAAVKDGVDIAKYTKTSKPFTVLRVTQVKGVSEDDDA